MADKKLDTRTLMNVFFGIVLIVVLAGFVFSASFSVSPLSRGNYSSNILLNCTTSIINSTGTARSSNVTFFYNASGGPTGTDTSISNIGNLTGAIWNDTASGGNDSEFNATADISGLADGATYNISCYADNGTVQEWGSVINITIDNTPPAVNFSDTASVLTATNGSIINNGNYSATDIAKLLYINVSVSDAIFTNLVNSGGDVFLNITNSSTVGQRNFTKLSNVTAPFFNATINVTDAAVYPDGKYNITIWANDSIYLRNASDDVLSNLNNSEYIQFTIDRTPPSSVTLTAGTGTTTTKNVITITAVDATSGINTCSVGGSGVTITGTGTGTQTLTQTGLNCGTSYSYIVTCADQAGNTKTSTSTSFSTSSCSSGGSGGGGGSGTTNAIEKVNILDIIPGADATISNFADEMGVKDIKISVNEEADNVKITVKKFDTQPAEISVAKTGNVHKYLQIKSQNLGDKLDKAIVTIKVQKNWLLDNSIDKANIALYKFDESAGKWKELSTVYKSEDDNYYYYDTELTSFSYFAISEKVIKEPEVVPEPEPEKNLLWLWIIIGIVLVAVIVGGGFAVKKRKS